MKRFNLNRTHIISALVIVVVIFISAIVSNRPLQKDDDFIPTLKDTANVIETETDYFRLGRLERDQKRRSAQEVYREVIASKYSTEDSRQQALQELTASAKASETEVLIEGSLRGRGFEENIVYLTSSSADVVVRTVGLTPAHARQIKDVVIEQAGISSDKIKIVEIR